MKKTVFLSFIILVSATISLAQNVGINTTGAAPAASAMLDVAAANKGVLLPQVSLTGATDVITVPSPANSLLLYNTATAGAAPDNVIPGFYYWATGRWNRLATAGGSSSLLPFSSGTIINGATMVSAAPVLIGFGNNTVSTIDGSGQSVSPPQSAGFSFVVPFNGIIENLQVSADAFVASTVLINVIGLQYDFQVFRSPSVPNNGVDHLASPYLTSPLNSSVRFGFPNSIVTAGSFRAASNLNTGAIAVSAGDRIGIRVRTNQPSDPSAMDISQLAFSASLMYTPAQ